MGRYYSALGCLVLTSCTVSPKVTGTLPPAESPAAPVPLAVMADAQVASPPEPVARKASPTFAEDVAFLASHGEVITLESPAGGVIAVSAQYQGRVMTSAVGKDRPSLGYVNRSFIAAGETGTRFDNYGGEDRFWLGPEGGQLALYFPAGKPFEFEHWQTPAAFQEGTWTVAERTATAVVLTRAMKVVNYAGTTFELTVKRTVRLLGAQDIAALLGANPPPLDGLGWVAYETVNEITNTGKNAWTAASGAPSVWILAMFTPSPDTWAVLPFEPQGTGEVVNDRYFGEVPAERLVIDPAGRIFFKCDGQHRSKIGLGPTRAKTFLGSYSAEAALLTLVSFERPPGATAYVNSMWETQALPFGGDVVNSYNDGPVEPGKPALGGFYELETSSPAAFLRPGERLVHTHRTLHFQGEPGKLTPLMERALGTSPAQIPKNPGAKP